MPSSGHTKLRRQKDSSPSNGLITPTKFRKQFPRKMLSTVNFAAVTHLETEYTDYVNVLKNRLTTEQAVVK